MIDRLVTNIFERCDLIQKFCRQSRGSRLRSPFCRYSIDQIGKRESVTVTLPELPPRPFVALYSSNN